MKFYLVQNGILKSFNPNLFINIGDHIENKIATIKLYKNEIKGYPHSRSLKSIRSLASFRELFNQALNMLKLLKL